MNNNVRRLTDGAMMLAIIGALLLINRQTAGIIETTFLFILPLPMVFYSARYGLKSSAAVIASSILLCVVLGTPQTIFYVAAESCIGAYYGNGIYTKVETDRLLITTMVFSAFVAVLTMLVFASFFGYDLGEELTLYKEMFSNMNAQSGINLDAMVNVDNFLKEIMIVSTILSGLLDGLVIHLVSRLLLKRFHYALPPAKSIEQYFPHKISGYIALAGMFGYMYTIQKPLANDTIQMAAQGIGMACLFFLAVFGMIGVYSFLRIKFPFVGKWIILPIFFLCIGLNMFIAFLGFMYITTDFHHRLLEEK